MADSPQNTPARVFISYAWKNQPMAKLLQVDLQRDGVEVFVDYQQMTPGQSLPKRISDALKWCNTLVLLWSNSSEQSYWVTLEWENAIALRKQVIPCLLDNTELPPVLARTLFLDFSDYDSGHAELCRALGVNPVAPASEKKGTSGMQGLTKLDVTLDELSSVVERKSRSNVSSKNSSRRKLPPAPLCHTSSENLTINEVKVMLVERNFYAAEYDWNKDFSNPRGMGIDNDFEVQDNGAVVFDKTTGLMWQQSGSENEMTFADAEKYVRNLFLADYSNWRLPTLEEAMSLIEPKKYNGLYIDLKFDRKQRWIWTADKRTAGMAWVVSFGHGYCYDSYLFYDYYVRAVR